MKNTNELLKHLQSEFSPNDFAKNKELAMLYVYCQQNKTIMLSALPDKISHFYKKYLNLYSIKEMMVLLRENGNLNQISIKLAEHLRLEDQKGRTKFMSNNPTLNMLVMKYL